MVCRKSSERFSVRHFSHGVRHRDRVADLTFFWWQANRGFEEVEHRSTDSRRRSAGTHGEAGHANHGRSLDRRFRLNFDALVGQVVEHLLLDSNGCHFAFCGHRVRRRLRKDGEEAESGINGPTEVGRTVSDRGRGLGSSFHFDKVLG